jgi:hypothetical protein
MKAVLNIGNIKHLLLPLDTAVDIATKLKEAIPLDRQYSGERYTSEEDIRLVELEIVTDEEAARWLS